MDLAVHRLLVPRQGLQADRSLILDVARDRGHYPAALPEVVGEMACRDALGYEVASDGGTGDEHDRTRNQRDREHPGPDARPPASAPRLSPPGTHLEIVSHECVLSMLTTV